MNAVRESDGRSREAARRAPTGPPFTPFELTWALGVSAAGLALRIWHLGTPSLWWDEIVHLATAWQGDALSVFRAAKLGVPPGFGNAGAVPVDYLVLHAYLRAVPMPNADALEAYFRAPACVFSALTPLLLWLWVRRSFDRGVALVAATLLAFSVPHVLYAVEARPYALFTCLTVVQFATFAWLGEKPSAIRWIVFGAVSVLYVLTGLMGLIVVAIMYALLLTQVFLRMLRREMRFPLAVRDVVMLASVGLGVAGVLRAYLSGSIFWPSARRKADVASDPIGTMLETLSYYAADSALLCGLLGLSVPVLLVASRRTGGRYRPLLVVALLLTLIAVIPVVVELERRKRYYFHPRHALFILPVACTIMALTLDVVLRWLAGLRGEWRHGSRRRVAIVALELAVVLLVTVRPAAAYVASPFPFFARTKTLRDFKAFSRTVRDLTRSAAADEKVLVVAQRSGSGFLANPVLTLYLRWYGLESKVVLRGASNPATPQLLSWLCSHGCRGRDGKTLAIGATDVLDVPIGARWLLGIGRPFGAWPGRLRSVVVVTYDPVPSGPWSSALVQQKYRGLTSWISAADL